ncbi:thymidylate synthase/dCMP hydroxymethylase domain-containing protein [Gorgonomyces haynaldii]|nr:thymidylate synthase/dCMP hydroxymethylase domain-containing protein [Gorgonomyces haynaldii]
MIASAHPESQYLSLVQEIIDTGSKRSERTGTGTVSVFAPPQLRFPLDRFPLLTTKRVFLRPVFEELMWFIRGQTDATILSKKNVKIWDLNGTREALDQRGLGDNRVGDLGPIYGFQWRHFGAEYTNCDSDYSGQGVDQLWDVVNKIMHHPTDRRILLSAWNPQAIPKMALPPCHVFCQFYVDNQKLSCQLYQRSCDMGLGVPFNIASYSMLVLMLCHLTGLEPGTFVHCMGDAHVYLNHIEPLKTQLEREPKPFPLLKFKSPKPELEGLDQKQRVDAVIRALEQFEFADLDLVDYDPYPKIAMDMSV